MYDSGNTNAPGMYAPGDAFAWKNSAGSTEWMRINSTGLGIGTASPAARLNVSSTGNGNRALFDDTTNDNTLGIYSDSTDIRLLSLNNARGSYKRLGFQSNVIVFSASNGSESCRIDTSGNLLLGTTATNVNSGGHLFIRGADSNYYIGHSGSPSGSIFHAYQYNGTTIGSVTQSGTTAVLYNTTSDQRLKENIVDAPEFGSVIDSIKVRSYDWKSDGSHQRAGFVAQELLTVAPEAVHQPADTEQMMAVDYSKLVPMLVKEIQSLRKRLVDAGI